MSKLTDVDAYTGESFERQVPVKPAQPVTPLMKVILPPMMTVIRHSTDGSRDRLVATVPNDLAVLLQDTNPKGLKTMLNRWMATYLDKVDHKVFHAELAKGLKTDTWYIQVFVEEI